MRKVMTFYSVKQVSEMAGVSIRTLHHYDRIGLLKPAERAESRYRYYNRADLLRLQQILFYRELGFALKEITEILDDEDFDLLQALRFQRNELLKKAGAIKQLIQTLDKTIIELKTGKKMKEQEMYEGFTREETVHIRKEVKERWGEKVLHESEERIGKLDPGKWAAVREDGEEVARKLAGLTHLPPDAAEVQEVIEQHYNWLCNFYEVFRERYLGLSRLYVEDERFKAYYDKHGEGTADLLSGGMVVYAERFFETD